MEYRSTLLAVAIVGLLLLGVAMFVLGELFVAGVSFLAASLTIYFRESD